MTPPVARPTLGAPPARVPLQSPPDVVVERWRRSEDGRRYWYTFRAPKDRPCARCPWLVENHGIVDVPPQEQEGAYLPSTRADLWHRGRREDGGGIGCASAEFYNDGERSLADGSSQACHIRREEKPASRTRPARLTVCWCTGQRVLAERELLRFIEHGLTGSALTRTGAGVYAATLLGRRRSLTWAEFDALTVADVLPFTHPSLLDEHIGFEECAPVSDAERKAWTGRGTDAMNGLG